MCASVRILVYLRVYRFSRIYISQCTRASTFFGINVNRQCQRYQSYARWKPQGYTFVFFSLSIIQMRNSYYTCIRATVFIFGTKHSFPWNKNYWFLAGEKNEVDEAESHSYTNAYSYCINGVVTNLIMPMERRSVNIKMSYEHQKKYQYIDLEILLQFHSFTLAFHTDTWIRNDRVTKIMRESKYSKLKSERNLLAVYLCACVWVCRLLS